MSLSLPYVAGFFDGEGSVGVYGYSTRLGQRYSLVVQTTQVDMAAPRRLFEELRAAHGGNVSWQATASGRGKLNWQIKGDRAAGFLETIAPYLVLKREQAEIGAAWQRGREKFQRGPDGRVMRMTTEGASLNDAVARLLAALKRYDIDVLMADHADLVEVRRTVHQVLNYKGT